jgi:acetyl esterase/lipase
MRRLCLVVVTVVTVGFVSAPNSARGQSTDPLRRLMTVAYAYRTTPNITYLTATNFDAKLDVYQPVGVTTPNPTLVFFHGGGWTGGSKEGNTLTNLLWMDMGWTVVNVEYRLAKNSPAPAAVEDCLCAMRWIYRNAKQYNFDTSRIVVTGQSAGGHLALTTGMIPASAGLDRQCPGTEDLKVAAIVDWYGITDVNDLLEGPNMRTYAVQWLGSMPNRAEVAKRISPLTYVRPGLPPILMIQGDADPTVPYTHSLRLREALDKAGVPNELVTVAGGKHGNFTVDENLKNYAAIRAFLTRHKLIAETGRTNTSSQ